MVGRRFPVDRHCHDQGAEPREEVVTGPVNDPVCHRGSLRDVQPGAKGPHEEGDRDRHALRGGQHVLRRHQSPRPGIRVEEDQAELLRRRHPPVLAGRGRAGVRHL